MRAGGGLRQGPNPTSERKDSLRRYVSFRRARGARMARRHGTRETLQSARKHLIIKEIQAAVARERQVSYMQPSRLLVSYPGMKELLRQVLETAPLSDRRIMAAAMLGSAVLLTVAAMLLAL